MLCLNAPARPLLPAVSETTIALLLKKRDCGRPVSGVWRRIVRDEIQRAVRYLDSLTPRERDDACRLLDWYISEAAESCDKDWLQLYRPEERDRRSSCAMFFYYAHNVDLLTVRERHCLIDSLEDYFARYREFYSEWMYIYF